MMEKLKVGVAGVSRGNAYLRAFGIGERSEIKAVCDLDQNRLENAAELFGLGDSQCYTDYDSFINDDIDIVVVGTPIPLHAEQTVKAIKAGKHVFSEVTATDTLEGCAAIYDAVKASDRKYMLAENYIYLDYIQQWKKYIDEGRIGRIHYAEAEYIHDIRPLLVDKGSGETFWRTYRPPVTYCSHCLGPLLFLTDDDYVVKATAMGNKNTIMLEFWPSTIDMQVAVFETKQERITKILRSQVTPREPHIVTYNVYGTKGSLETGRTPGYDTIGKRYFEGSDRRAIDMNCNGTELDASPEIRFGGHGTSDYYIAQAFLDSIEHDKEPPISVDRAMELTVPGLIAHEAAVKGNIWLDVPHFD